jgi:hypothetical protein
MAKEKTIAPRRGNKRRIMVIQANALSETPNSNIQHPEKLQISTAKHSSGKVCGLIEALLRP